MNRASSTERALRLGIGFVWFATAVLVLHPTYRAIGAAYLGRAGLPAWLMYAACAGELCLALYLALARPTLVDTAAQTAAIVFFTVLLGVVDPMLLVDPFGVLTKNIPLVAVVWAAYWWRMPGRRTRTLWLLRIAAAAPWISEGLGPKLLVQQQVELDVVSGSGFIPMSPVVFLYILGAAQLASGIAALLLRGRLLRWLLIVQAISLAVLPLLVSIQLPLLWVHPFGPLIKNVPILVATIVVLRECSSST